MREATQPSRPRSEAQALVGGILLIVGTVLCFSCMDASAKWLSRQVNPVQVIAVRYGLSFVFFALFVNPWSRPNLMRTRRLPLQCVRALCILGSTATGWTALRFLALTKVTSITFAAPLIVAVLAGPMLGERIGPRRAVAVCVGFIGVLVITRPFAGAFNWAALLAISAALCNALYSILTRRLAAYDRPETTMFYTGLVGTVVMAPFLPFTWAPPPSWQAWAVLVLLGGFGALAHWLLILAHRLAPATALAPFYYVQIIGAVVLGFVVFGEVPDHWTIAGGAIVTGSGLYLFWRERVRQKPVPSVDMG